MKTTYTTYSRQTGLTLVEILVAMVISLILMAGVLQIFQANKQSFRVQESLSLVQENGRTAMRILTEDLRMAAYWGCRSQDINPGYITNNLDPAGAGYVDLLINGGVSGTNGVGAGITPDSITIEGAQSTGVAVSADMADETANISVTDSSGLQPGDIMLITDCEAGDIFQITNAASLGPADPIEHAIGGAPGNITAELSRVYEADKTMVFQARQATYSITPDPDSGEPSLSLTGGGGAPVMLVEGIEDLQILFGEQPAANAGDMRYVPADAAGLNMDQVHSLRITLVARSSATNVAVGGDGRLRRTFNTTISIRNRNP